MENNKGSIIVIVLMVLGIVSLLGVTLISQSKLDLQFSSSVGNYDRMFGLADGAAAYALRSIQNDAKRGYCVECSNPEGGLPIACKNRLGTSGADAAGDATPANWPAPWTCTRQVTLPDVDIDSAGRKLSSFARAFVVKEQTTGGGGSADPWKISYRIYAQAWTSVWGGGAGSAAPNSTIEIPVVITVPSTTTCP